MLYTAVAMIFKGKTTPRKLEEIEAEGDELLQQLPSGPDDLNNPSVNARLLEAARKIGKRAADARSPDDKERVTLTKIREKLLGVYQQIADKPEWEPWRHLMVNTAEKINHILQRTE